MTHAEAFETMPRPPGMAPTACPGELHLLGTYEDGIIVHSVYTVTQIELYKCLDCNARVSVRNNVILNAYTLPAEAPAERT